MTEQVRTFLDRIRLNPEKAVLTFSGFDPDYDTSGLAQIEVLEQVGVRKIVEISADVIEIKKPASGMEAVSRMVQAIAGHLSPVWASTSAIVEGQQIYPNPESSREKLVAQGNDLLLLGLVSGAAAARFVQAGTATRILLPRQWKKQRKKQSQQAELGRLLMAHRPKVFVQDLEVVDSPVETLLHMCSHAIDAVLMAVTAAGFKV